jgi:hypothetical protein
MVCEGFALGWKERLILVTPRTVVGWHRVAMTWRAPTLGFTNKGLHCFAKYFSIYGVEWLDQFPVWANEKENPVADSRHLECPD